MNTLVFPTTAAEVAQWPGRRAWRLLQHSAGPLHWRCGRAWPCCLHHVTCSSLLHSFLKLYVPHARLYQARAGRAVPCRRCVCADHSAPNGCRRGSCDCTARHKDGRLRCGSAEVPVLTKCTSSTHAGAAVLALVPAAGSDCPRRLLPCYDNASRARAASNSCSCAWPSAAPVPASSSLALLSATNSSPSSTADALRFLLGDSRRYAICVARLCPKRAAVASRAAVVVLLTSIAEMKAWRRMLAVTGFPNTALYTLFAHAVKCASSSGVCAAVCTH